jgi:Secretion system C-terminal sorting domain
MKKLAIVFYFISFSFFGQTSMTFTGSSYMYVRDRFVYVKDGIDMAAATSNIFLRSGGQLLQAGSATTSNKGIGKLSVFQEGTVNNFAYNYWCSPVGNASAAVGNENFGITMLNRPTTNIASTIATNIAAPNYNGTTTNTTLDIARYWIFTFRSGLNYSNWVSINNTTNLLPGEGFTMKGTSGTDTTVADATEDKDPVAAGLQPFTNNSGSNQRYDFRGKPNDGTITRTVSNGRRTLIGNPYPSAIDLKLFLASANNTTKIAYFWEQDKTVNTHILANYQGGYGTYSPLLGPTVAPFGNMGVYTPAVFYAYNGSGTQLGSVGSGNNYERRFCPIGQGFMVEGLGAGTTVEMNNTFRVYQKEGAATYSQFERGTNTSNSNSNFLPEIPSVSGFDYTTVSTLEIPQIRFNSMVNNAGIRQSALVFVDGATDGIDVGMDAKTMDDPTTDVYFALNESDSYVINAIEFDINKTIPIGFKNTTPANFKFTMNEMINFADTEEVFMHDKINNTYTDIKNGLFEVNLPAGTNNNQYEITFINASLNNQDFIANDISIYQNNTKQVLTIANPNLQNIKNISLYDVVGKEIFTKQQLAKVQNHEFSTSTLSDGVYIVKLYTSENKTVSQKVIVSNLK